MVQYPLFGLFSMGKSTVKHRDNIQPTHMINKVTDTNMKKRSYEINNNSPIWPIQMVSVEEQKNY
jgi:hypothetical protein